MLTHIRSLSLILYSQSLARPARTALLCGLASALALPPVNAWPVLFVTFNIFVVILTAPPSPLAGEEAKTLAYEAQRGKSLVFAGEGENKTAPLSPLTPPLSRKGRGRHIVHSFKHGFLFAFGFHVAGLYWIANSMLVDAAKFWWAIPFAVAGLPAFFALYTGTMMAALAVLRQRLSLAPIGTILLFIPLYMLAEVARSRFLTGFEWNLLASVWNNTLPMLQSASLIGAYGLSALTLLLVLAPAFIAFGARRFGIAIITGAAILFAWGAYHLNTRPTTYVPNVQLRLVQPNIPQELKWDAASRDSNMDTLLRLSDSSAGLTPTHIIWPEAAAPYILNKDENARLAAALRAPANGLVITGSIWRDDLPDAQKTYTNSAVAINSTGAITARFNKFHLVPFGEYFPARAWLAAHGVNVNAIAAGNKDFTAGAGPRTITLKNIPPVSPLICYEVVYSGRVTDPTNRPAWLLNLTNDAWFGTSSGPYQHFASARLRAVEEGLPLVRVANTGISGVVDAYGRITAITQLNTQTVLDHGLPENATQTPFSHHGHALFILMLVILTLGALRYRTK